MIWLTRLSRYRTVLGWTYNSRAHASTCPPESRYARSVTSTDESAPRSGVTIRSTSIAAAPLSPPSTLSGNRSMAATGRGALGHPLTAAAPDSASAALSGASTSDPTVCPWTTGAPVEKASSTAGGIEADDSRVPERITTRRAPCTTASACLSDATAALCTAGTDANPRSSRGEPTITVAAVVGSQLSAEAPEVRSAWRSPRTTASTIIASIRVSQAPRFSAAAA